jgi:hypothetical protein
MKRKRSLHGGDRSPKRPKAASSQSACATPQEVDHPVLRRLYPEVLSLRHYVLSRLPTSSKNRRRRILQLGQSNPSSDVDCELGQLLDSTLVGVTPKAATASRDEVIRTREREIQSFSQQLSDCATGGTYIPGYFLQSEVGILLLLISCLDIYLTFPALGLNKTRSSIS